MIVRCVNVDGYTYEMYEAEKARQMRLANQRDIEEETDCDDTDKEARDFG